LPPTWAGRRRTSSVRSTTSTTPCALRSHPFLPHRDRVRGFVYDVDTGRLREGVA